MGNRHRASSTSFPMFSPPLTTHLRAPVETKIKRSSGFLESYSMYIRRLANQKHGRRQLRVSLVQIGLTRFEIFRWKWRRKIHIDYCWLTPTPSPHHHQWLRVLISLQISKKMKKKKEGATEVTGRYKKTVRHRLLDWIHYSGSYLIVPSCVFISVFNTRSNNKR